MTRPWETGPSQAPGREAFEAADNAAAARLRVEAQAAQGIADAEAVAEALDLLDQAALQVSPRTLPEFADRAARLHAVARARLRRVRRRANRQ